MAGRECYHCKQWIDAGAAHDCWTTTEAALTRDLPEDLRDAWERIRDTAADLGEQRIYASHSSIMFARRVCYAFVRPKRKYLELWIFLAHPVQHPLVARVESSSSWKFCNLVRITHRDQVEAPVTDWLAEAYRFVDAPRPTTAGTTQRPGRKKSARKKSVVQQTAVQKVASRKVSPATRAGSKTRTARKVPAKGVRRD